MIRALRRRFLLIAMASLAGTLALLCLAINLGYRHMVTQRADAVLVVLAALFYLIHVLYEQ